MPDKVVKKRKHRPEIRKEKDQAKRNRRKQRDEYGEKVGEHKVPKQTPKTIENAQEPDDTFVQSDDEEVLDDLDNDEMANFVVNKDMAPKILITTSPGAKMQTFKLCFELRRCIPNSQIYTRKNVPMKKVVKQAIQHQFTDIIVVHEDNKKPNGILFCHLSNGPTAYFKINSLQYTKQNKDAVESTHYPELILNNFKTRVGKTISRMFACLFSQKAEFAGRRVVTFHNQRDYVFFRHHRYEFKKEGQKAALHELGPRITLRLKWVQKGTFDTRNGEYEWILKRHEMEKSRKKFLLCSGDPRKRQQNKNEKAEEDEDEDL